MEIKGIIVPLLTPMHEDESVNEQELRNQVKRLIKAGVHGIFPLGTNGEGYILNKKEKEHVLSVVIEETGAVIPVFAGTGCISTKETIEQSLTAKSLGADALSIITPSFCMASQYEIYSHYKEVASAVDLPVILYNIPARTGNSITPETASRLSEIHNIIGIKDSSGNFNNMLQYIEMAKGKDFSVLSGNDSLILWNLLAGGNGGISGCANVYPAVIVSIYHAFLEENIEKAKEIQESISSFRNCFRFGNPNTIVKAAVELLGYPVGKCRKPFHHISDEGMQALRSVLKENKQKGMC